MCEPDPIQFDDGLDYLRRRYENPSPNPATVVGITAVLVIVELIILFSLKACSCI